MIIIIIIGRERRCYHDWRSTIIDFRSTEEEYEFYSTVVTDTARTTEEEYEFYSTVVVVTTRSTEEEEEEEEEEEVRSTKDQRTKEKG